MGKRQRCSQMPRAAQATGPLRREAAAPEAAGQRLLVVVVKRAWPRRGGDVHGSAPEGEDSKVEANSRSKVKVALVFIFKDVNNRCTKGVFSSWVKKFRVSYQMFHEMLEEVFGY